MAETGSEAELGRSNKSATPGDHLRHLLNVGWEPASPLIQKYVLDHQLQRDLEEWLVSRK